MQKYIPLNRILLLLGLFLLIGAMSLYRQSQEVISTYNSFQSLQHRRYEAEHAAEILSEQNRQLAALENQALRAQSATLKLHTHLDFVSYLETAAKESGVQILSLPKGDSLNAWQDTSYWKLPSGWKENWLAYYGSCTGWSMRMKWAVSNKCDCNMRPFGNEGNANTS